MALTAEQHKLREGRLTASRVACLMTGDPAAIHDLWRELTGDPTWVAESLADNWAVQFGSATEAINLFWFEKKRGDISRRGEVVISTKADWASCTLDAWSDWSKCPIECKTVGGFEKLDVIIQRYQPQMQWQMLMTEAKQCALSVIQGAKEPVVEFIPFDEEYALEMWRRAEQFMEHVRNLTPPVDLTAVDAPIIPSKEISMEGNNEWAIQADIWLGSMLQASMFETAEKELKKLMPPHAKKVFGHGVEASRNKAGRIKLDFRTIYKTK